MVFFHVCCNNRKETHRDGAFIAYCDGKSNGVGNGAHLNGNGAATPPPPHPSQHSDESSYGSHSNGSGSTKGRIPWVWSRTFHENYQLGRVLGQGAFSIVHEATYRRPPHVSYAIKIIDRNKLSRQDVTSFKDEVQILSDLRHENIIRLYEIYKAPYYFFVVLEKLDGGELFDRLCEKHTYVECDARNVCKTVFDAMAFCHGHNVAHRDLKPENLLLKNTTDDTAIKIADFGFAKRVKRPNSLTTRCGSPAYTAPEIINYKPYDQRADNWSLGVIMYTVLGGYPPFYEKTVHLTFQQILQGNYQFHHEYWDGISPDAKNFIKSLLTVDPDKRMLSKDALQHPWLTGRGNDGVVVARNRKELSANLKQFKKFNSERKRETVVKNFDHYWLLSRR